MSFRHLSAPPLIAAFAWLLLAGCGGGGGGAHDGPTVWDADNFHDAHEAGATGDDGAPDDGGLPGDDGPLVGPTNGLLAVDFEADVTGTGTTRVGPVSLVANAAAYTFGGAAHVGVAYQHHAWAPWTLYDIVSIAEDGSNLAVTYLYCQGSALTDAYTESFVDAMDWEVASGTCAGTETPWTVEVSLPALQVAPTALDTGMSVSGTDIEIGAGGGQLVLAGDTWDVVPFNTVDCSTTCPGGSWYELHVMLLRPGAACFTVLYLFPDDPSVIQLEYTLCLPSLSTPEAVYSATWSGTLLSKLRSARLWRPPAPALELVREVHGDVALPRPARP
jgi:hypothetical protein